MAQNPINPDLHSRIVMLVFGAMNHGGPYWCYVAVKPSRYDAFQTALAGNHYNLQYFENDGYGEVIVSGEGTLPPETITKQVADMFAIPIKQLFAAIDPKQVVSDKIKALGHIPPVTPST